METSPRSQRRVRAQPNIALDTHWSRNRFMPSSYGEYSSFFCYGSLCYINLNIHSLGKLLLMRSVAAGRGHQRSEPFDVGFPGSAVGKNPPANAGDARDAGLIPGSRRSPGGGHGNPLQYSCLKNSTDRRAWRATVYGVAKSRTWLSDWARTASSISLF